MNQIKLILCLLLTLLPLHLKTQITFRSDQTLRQLQSCQSGCLTCSSSEVCTDCDTNRVLEDGKCRCEAPRVLRGNDCECPWYMSENPTTQDCEYIDLIDVAYQTTVSPLFDAIFQVQMNPRLKWALSPTFTWTVSCNYQDTDSEDQLNTYLSTQQSDFLRIPSSLLEYNFQCNVKVSYNNQNSLEISKEFSFNTMMEIQPQVQIVGGAFQMLRHSETNLILAEVQSGSSNLKITWTQLSGDTLDMSLLRSSSHPERLTIPKCTLSPGKLYSFKVSAQYGTNPLLTAQTITFGVYSPKISLQSIETNAYHIYTDALTLTASQFSVQDECQQGLIPAQFLDMLSIEYTWECAIVDLSENTRLRRLLDTESSAITENANVVLHPDPQNLFYTSTTSETLTIPSSYFTPYQGFQLIFYLTATVPSKNPTPSLKNFNLIRPTLYTSQTKASVQILASKPFTDVSFTCANQNGCQAFTENDLTLFYGLNYDPKLTYTWLVQAPSIQFVTRSYNNWLTANPIWPITAAVSQIILQVTDGTNTASSFFTLPVQAPIQTGSLYVYPSSGAAYNTNFFISTYLSEDDDLPISYQFFSVCTPGRNFMLRKYEPFDYTTLVLPPGRGKCSVGVRLTDNLGHFDEILKSITLTGRCTSLSEALSKNTQAMDSSESSTNIYQRLRLISVILENLQAWETADPDESLNENSSQLKYSAISETKDIFLALSPRDDIKVIMFTNLMYATNPLINQDRNWELYMSILDNYYQAASETSIMDSALTQSFAEILDNLIYYMKKPGNGIQDPEKILTYLNTLTRSSVHNAFPTSEAFDGFIFDGTFSYVYTKKTTYCQALQPLPVLFYYGMETTFTFKPGETIPPEQCNDEADYVFMAFRPKYTVPDEDITMGRSLIFVDLRDSSTGESLLDIYDFSIYSALEYCPDGPVTCVNDDSGGTTITGTFDLRNQIYRIFGRVYPPPGSIPGEDTYEILKRIAFWTVVVASIWFLATFCWLYFTNSTFCALKAPQKISQKPLFKKVNLLFWLTHPLFSIFLYNDPKTAKATRLAIYYQRLVVIITLSTMFSLISQENEAILQAYIILFNILTILPINFILTRIFSWSFQIKPSKKKSLKQSFAVLFYISLLVACFIAIFAIDTQQDEYSWNKDWAINFAISFIQDLTLAPLISIIIKTLLINCSKNKKRTSKTMTFLLQNFKPIYTSIFKNVPTPIETQAPSPTEIASPMSTSRKLLKLPTLDSSPILPKSPAKRAFRTRRVSDTEMANVDSVAVETLVTDRFQTLFGEGKTERVKENSPIKQNYERMQSANIASAKFSTPSRLVSPRDFNLNGERKFVNLTSIILHPSSPLSGSVAEIGPEDGLFSSIGSPKESSSPRLLKGNKNLESPREKEGKNQPERCQTVI